MPGYEIPGFAFSYMSVGNVLQFTAVTIGATGAGVATAALDIDGVAQMPAVTAKPETIRIMKDGITFAVASAAIAIGAEVQVSTTGRFATKTSGVAVGKALTAAGAANEQFALLLY